MTALEIKVTKNMMNALLASGQFDSFLVEEATVATFNTFHIDGHIIKDFYTKEELAELEDSEASTEFSRWGDIRPICFQLIKGKKTPLSFKAVLLAPPALVKEIAAAPGCTVDVSLIRSLALNIRYEGGKVTCVTGSALTTFIMDKSVDQLWDAYVRRLLLELGLEYEEA